jgi:L-cysteine desulfidase
LLNNKSYAWLVNSKEGRRNSLISIQKYKLYLDLLKKELVPATGCTEPVSIALAAAKAREVLGSLPDQIFVQVSENIMKNTKSVSIPNTDQLKGIKAAVAAGVIAGNSNLNLDVISQINNSEKKAIIKCINDCSIDVEILKSQIIYDITIKAFSGAEYSKVRIANDHTNFVLIEKNGKVIYKKNEEEMKNTKEKQEQLNVKDIIHFANSVHFEDIKEILEKQILMNTTIANEGLMQNYGANIGKVLMSMNDTDISNRAKAMTAAASDARMGGCQLPVVINSGSGNQGLTASIPVIVYAKELGVSNDKLYRALVVSNLITIHLKKGIGPLSAYCGAVSAGAGSGAGIAYLYGGDYQTISHTIVNALAIVSGMICDGAKPSCSAKIASSVDAGILGYQMYLKDQQFHAGEGIISNGVEETISNISRLATEGMSLQIIKL